MLWNWRIAIRNGLVEDLGVTRSRAQASTHVKFNAPGDGRLRSIITCRICAIMAPGERSEEVWLWYTAVYEAIQEIPHGQVTSYGHIARLVGKRELRALMKMMMMPLADAVCSYDTAECPRYGIPAKSGSITCRRWLTHDVEDKLGFVSRTCPLLQPMAASRTPGFTAAMYLGSA